MSCYFISAIDTDVGKSIATGLLANELQKKQRVITMKIAQTGCEGISEDIKKHRQLMNSSLLEEDKSKLTCPYVFSYPASPHFSAALENSCIDINTINHSLTQLNNRFDTVLLEGVGGLMVPLTPKLLLIDYLKSQSFPLILVTSGKLGSINHTLLSLMALQQTNINLHGIIYNNYPNDNHPINNSSKQYIQDYITKHFPNTLWGEMQTLGHLNHSTHNIALNLDKKALWFNASNG